MKTVKLSVNYFLKRVNIIILIKRVAYRGDVCYKEEVYNKMLEENRYFQNIQRKI